MASSSLDLLIIELKPNSFIIPVAANLHTHFPCYSYGAYKKHAKSRNVGLKYVLLHLKFSENAAMGDLLKKFLDVTCKYGFLKTGKNVINFGPLALVLANNLRLEWYNDSFIQSDTSMFLIEDIKSINWQEDINTSFRQSLHLANEQLPLGLVSMLTNFKLLLNEETQNDSLYQADTNVYRCLRFIDPSKSQQSFYHLQRSRSIWWRKFARDPKIFKLNEVIKGDEKNTVQIVAELPWMDKTVETILFHGSRPLESYGSMFEVKVGRKRVLPHVIESVCLEGPATLAYLSDAFQPLSSRTLLRLHNRLTPYKAATAIESNDKNIKELEELNQLAEFLNLSLRRAGLHTLFSSNQNYSKGVESQFTNHDLLGIPYTVVIKDETLRNGIAGLRSRDTTLQEQVHISQITSYMQQLFKK